MTNLRFVTHLDVFATVAQFHKLVSGDQWAGKSSIARMSDPKMQHNTLMLRVQNKPSVENWLDDLPMHDQPVYADWKSLRNLLTRARRAILADPILGQAVDGDSPMGRVVISVMQPNSVMAWHYDAGEYAKRHFRFHIPLTTNPAAYTYAGPEAVHMQTGSLFYLNALVQHSSVNWGTSPRSHVIFELRRRDAGGADETA